MSEKLKEYQTLDIRIVDKPLEETKPEGKLNLYGLIYKWHDIWVLGCPRCGGSARLQHTVEIKDGKVTINPSVGCPFCHAHYYVRNGKVEILGEK